jgi:hypothetical protein
MGEREGGEGGGEVKHTLTDVRQGGIIEPKAISTKKALGTGTIGARDER